MPGAERAGQAGEDELGDLVVDSIAAVARTSDRGRFIALILGGGATLLAASGVVEKLRWVHVLAWRVAPRREHRNPWLVLGLVADVVLLSNASPPPIGRPPPASGTCSPCC